MYETYYDILQPYFGQENLQLTLYGYRQHLYSSLNYNNVIKDLYNLQRPF